MDHQFHSESLVNNVFSFEHPDDIGCVVWQYAVGHSEMEIQLFENNKGVIGYLEFTMVHYFSGPLRWHGANFKLHSWNDSLPLMKELGRLPDLEKAPEEIKKMMIGSAFKLHTISAIHPKVEIKILSAGGHLREKNE